MVVVVMSTVAELAAQQAALSAKRVRATQSPLPSLSETWIRMVSRAGALLPVPCTSQVQTCRHYVTLSQVENNELHPFTQVSAVTGEVLIQLDCQRCAALDPKTSISGTIYVTNLSLRVGECCVFHAHRVLRGTPPLHQSNCEQLSAQLGTHVHFAHCSSISCMCIFGCAHVSADGFPLFPAVHPALLFLSLCARFLTDRFCMSQSG